MDKEQRLQKELAGIEDKLIYLRERWRLGSPAMKRYIESAAAIHIKRKETIERKLNV